MLALLPALLHSEDGILKAFPGYLGAEAFSPPPLHNFNFFLAVVILQLSYLLMNGAHISLPSARKW